MRLGTVKMKTFIIILPLIIATAEQTLDLSGSYKNCSDFFLLHLSKRKKFEVMIMLSALAAQLRRSLNLLQKQDIQTAFWVSP